MTQSSIDLYSMSRIERDVLRDENAFLVENLTPDDSFLAECISKMVLSATFVEEQIRPLQTASGKAVKILENLPRRGPEIFSKFLEVLERRDHKHVAARLKKKLEENMESIQRGNSFIGPKEQTLDLPTFLRRKFCDIYDKVRKTLQNEDATAAMKFQTYTWKTIRFDYVDEIIEALLKSHEELYKLFLLSKKQLENANMIHLGVLEGVESIFSDRNEAQSEIKELKEKLNDVEKDLGVANFQLKAMKKRDLESFQEISEMRQEIIVLSKKEENIQKREKNVRSYCEREKTVSELKTGKSHGNNAVSIPENDVESKESGNDPTKVSDRQRENCGTNTSKVTISNIKNDGSVSTNVSKQQRQNSGTDTSNITKPKYWGGGSDNTNVWETQIENGGMGASNVTKPNYESGGTNTSNGLEKERENGGTGASNVAKPKYGDAGTDTTNRWEQQRKNNNMDASNLKKPKYGDSGTDTTNKREKQRENGDTNASNVTKPKYEGGGTDISYISKQLMENGSACVSTLKKTELEKGGKDTTKVCGKQRKDGCPVLGVTKPKHENGGTNAREETEQNRDRRGTNTTGVSKQDNTRTDNYTWKGRVRDKLSFNTKPGQGRCYQGRAGKYWQADRRQTLRPWGYNKSVGYMQTYPLNANKRKHFTDGKT